MTSDQLNKILKSAGVMADIAGKITGENLNVRAGAVSVYALSQWLETLRHAVREYNEACIAATRHD